MKTLSKLIAVITIFFVVSNAYAGGGHHTAGGPKGGRLLEHTEPLAEFFVEKDNFVTVTFYDQNLNPIPAAEQTVSLVAEKDGKKTTLDLEKKGDVLVSKEPLPEGHPIKLVLRFKQTSDKKPRNFRIVYDDLICNECKRAEYACICGH